MVVGVCVILGVSCFCFNDTATTEIYTYWTHSYPTRRSSDLYLGRSLNVLAVFPGAIIGFHPVLRNWMARNLVLVSAITGAIAFAILTLHSMRSEEHTSELQSLMRLSYAVFCLKKKKTSTITQVTINNTIYTQ